MTTAAILMLILSIVLVWGGLAASAISLFRRPDLAADDPIPDAD